MTSYQLEHDKTARFIRKTSDSFFSLFLLKKMTKSVKGGKGS
jgi:hypothetical protein